MMKLVRFAAAILALASHVAADDHVVDTDHYRLYAEGTRAHAEALALVLEPAWVELTRVFKAAPKLGKNERLVIRYYESEDRFHRDTGQDGAKKKHGGVYRRRNKTAYILHQRTAYKMRRTLLHEVVHQFHFLACTDNQPPALWYAEGLAESLAHHHWDGERLVLGVLPLVYPDDYAEKALRAVTTGKASVAQVVRSPAYDLEKLDHRLSWALVRFLRRGDDGKQLDGYARFTALMDKGEDSARAFGQCFGAPDRIEPRFRLWLHMTQQPFRAVAGRWEAPKPGALLATGRTGLCVCTKKQRAAELSATLVSPTRGKWGAGLLLHYENADNYAVAMVRWNGDLEVVQNHDGERSSLADEVVPKQGRYRLRAVRSGEVILLYIDGHRFGPWSFDSQSPFGFVALRCEALFESVGWQSPDKRD